MGQHASGWGGALLVCVTLTALIIAAGSVFGGCVRAETVRDRTHELLNQVTDIADPAYALSVVACDGREGVVIHDPELTKVEKWARVESIRAKCDQVFAAFDVLRRAQIGARKAVDAAEAGRSKWKAALAAAREATAAWRKAREALLGVPWLQSALEGIRAKE